MRGSAVLLIATFLAGHAVTATTSPSHLENVMATSPDVLLAHRLLRDVDHGKQLHKATGGNDGSSSSSDKSFSRSSSVDMSGLGSDVDEERFFDPEAEIPYLEQLNEQLLNAETMHHANEITAHVKEAKEKLEEAKEEESESGSESDSDTGSESDSDSDSESDSNSDSDDASSNLKGHKTHPDEEGMHSHPRVSDKPAKEKNEEAQDESEGNANRGPRQSESNCDSDDASSDDGNSSKGRKTHPKVMPSHPEKEKNEKDHDTFVSDYSMSGSESNPDQTSSNGNDP